MSQDIQTLYSKLFDDLIGKQVMCEFCGKIVYVNELVYERVMEKDLKRFICKECFEGKKDKIQFSSKSVKWV